MPKTNSTFDAAKETMEPLNGTINALSPEELEALKQSKSMEYLKAIINARGSSTKKSPSTSTMSGGQSTSKFGDELLLKIKEKAFNIDMFQLLEKDSSACFRIKDLLKQIGILNASLKAVDVIKDLGLLIDQVVVELNHIREVSNKIQNKSETQAAEWDAATKSTAKVAELEKGSEQNQ